MPLRSCAETTSFHSAKRKPTCSQNGAYEKGRPKDDGGNGGHLDSCNHHARRCECLLRDLVLDFSRPRKPTDNSYIESFNGKFRAECLNAHWFMTLDDARAKMEDWLREYDEFRPHGAIGNKVPISFMNGSSAPPPN